MKIVFNSKCDQCDSPGEYEGEQEVPQELERDFGSDTISQYTCLECGTSYYEYPNKAKE